MNGQSAWRENALFVEVRGRPHAKDCAMNVTQEPVFAAKSDFIDERSVKDLSGL